jgi:FkbM family methyltransferase
MHPPTLVRNALAKLTRACLVKGGWRLAPVLNRLFPGRRAAVQLPAVGRCLLDLEDEDQRQIYWAGLDASDKKIIRLVRRLLPPDGVFLDVGANIGIHTLAAAHHLQLGSGRVLAFEPHPENYRVLVHNLEQNSLANVRAEPAGLSDAEQTLEVRGAARPGNWSLASAGDLAFSVRLLRLDDYLQAHLVVRLDVVKLDIEGAEVKALRGARESLTRFRPVLVFEANPHWLARMGTSTEELFETVWGLDYQVHPLGNARSLWGPEVTPADLAGLGEQGWVNLVAVPRGRTTRS